MAAIDPQQDPRGARWEQRLHAPVLGAAWLSLPTVFLYFSDLGEAWEITAVALSWLIWIVFLAEAVIMLAVVDDRSAWIRGHLFGLAILIATLPLLTHVLEALLAARTLSALQGVRILQALYLAKAAKLLKSLNVLHRKGKTPKHPAIWTALILVLSVVVVGIGHKIATKDKDDITPLHGFWNLLNDLPNWALALSAAGLLLLIGAAVTSRSRRDRAATTSAVEAQ
jgi:hypothetical protein